MENTRMPIIGVCTEGKFGKLHCTLNVSALDCSIGWLRRNPKLFSPRKSIYGIIAPKSTSLLPVANPIAIDRCIHIPLVIS